MIYHDFHPEPPIGEHIDLILHYRSYRPEHSIERVVPDGTITLILELDGHERTVYDNETLQPVEKFRGAWVSGAQEAFLSISAVDQSRMLAVRFRPGGAAAFLGGSVDELTGRVIDARELFGETVRALRTRIVEADDPQESIRGALAWLADRFVAADGPPAPIRDVVERISAEPKFFSKRLADVAASAGYSHKHLISLFRRYVGLTPKRFQRIMRFSEILPHVVNKESVSWAQVSAECGYYDQSHFIREFKRFCGYNPQQFLDSSEHGRTNFIPVE